jgi:hypothetical protein
MAMQQWMHVFVGLINVYRTYLQPNALVDTKRPKIDFSS